MRYVWRTHVTLSLTSKQVRRVIFYYSNKNVGLFGYKSTMNTVCFAYRVFFALHTCAAASGRRPAAGRG